MDAIKHFICYTVFSSILSKQTSIVFGSFCNTIPNFCDRIQCESSADVNCNNGNIVGGGGICGCCDVCFQFRDFNENCTGDTILPIEIPFGNTELYIQLETCQPGYHCDEIKRTCTTYGTGCPSVKYESTTNDWEVTPNCNPYGYFESKRCKGRDNPRCFCVDKDGETIFGRIQEKDVNATCYCSRTVFEMKSTPSRANELTNIRCTETGDFDALQCWDDICFCIKKTTLEIIANAVPIAGIASLPCYDSATYTTNYYKTCESEKLKLMKMFRDFSKKGITTITLDMPECDPDGTYAQVQWSVKKWICSDRDGKQINNYIATTFDEREQMLCNCARDERYPDGLPPSQPPDCNLYGNYDIAKAKCFKDVCYCVDSDGQRRTDDFANDKLKPDCSQPH